MLLPLHAVCCCLSYDVRSFSCFISQLCNSRPWRSDHFEIYVVKIVRCFLELMSTTIAHRQTDRYPLVTTLLLCSVRRPNYATDRRATAAVIGINWLTWGGWTWRQLDVDVIVRADERVTVEMTTSRRDVGRRRRPASGLGAVPVTTAQWVEIDGLNERRGRQLTGAWQVSATTRIATSSATQQTLYTE